MAMRRYDLRDRTWYTQSFMFCFFSALGRIDGHTPKPRSTFEKAGPQSDDSPAATLFLVAEVKVDDDGTRILTVRTRVSIENACGVPIRYDMCVCLFGIWIIWSSSPQVCVHVFLGIQSCLLCMPTMCWGYMEFQSGLLCMSFLCGEHSLVLLSLAWSGFVWFRLVGPGLGFLASGLVFFYLWGKRVWQASTMCQPCGMKHPCGRFQWYVKHVSCGNPCGNHVACFNHVETMCRESTMFVRHMNQPYANTSLIMCRMSNRVSCVARVVPCVTCADYVVCVEPCGNHAACFNHMYQRVMCPPC